MSGKDPKAAKDADEGSDDEETNDQVPASKDGKAAAAALKTLNQDDDAARPGVDNAQAAKVGFSLSLSQDRCAMLT